MTTYSIPINRKAVLLFTLVSTLLGNYSLVQGIDLGNVIKNLGSNNAKAVSKHKTDLETVDASTGTITSHETGKGADPVTCDAFMAKAVVRANDEKMHAIGERDAAREEVNELTTYLAQVQVNLDEEVEARLAAEKLVEKIKLETNDAISQLEEKQAKEISKVKSEAQSQIDEIQIQLDELKVSSASEKESIKKEAEMMINTIKNDAAAKIKDIAETSTAQMAALKQELVDTIESMNEEMNILKETHKEDMRIIDEDYNKHILDFKQQLRNQHLSHTEEIEQMEKLHEEKLKLKEDELQKEIADITEDKKTALLEAQERLKKTQEASKSKLLTAENEAKALLDSYEKSRSTEIENLNKVIQTKNSEIDDLGQIITSLLKDKENLESSLANSENEVAQWIQLHNERTWVNTTLVIDDIVDWTSNIRVKISLFCDKLMNKVVFVSSEFKIASVGLIEKLMDKLSFVSSEFKIASVDFIQKCQVALEPHYKQVETKCIEYYNQHLQETVNRDVIPFYKKYILPPHKKYLLPMFQSCKKNVSKGMNKVHSTRLIIYKKMCQGTSFVALTLKKLLSKGCCEDHGTGIMHKLKRMIITHLDQIGKDSSSLVSFLCNFVSVLLFWRFKFNIIALIWSLVSMPFRIMWFFCPLRFFIRTGQNHEDRSIGTNGHSNGNGLNIKMKKE